MMPKLVIAQGPSGKTTAAYEWESQAPHDRKMIHAHSEFHLGVALGWLQCGFDVFIDPAGSMVVSPELFRGWASIEVRKFPEVQE